jgi:general stress protein 26
MTDDGRETVTKLLGEARFAMVTTTDAEGRLLAQPMTTQDVEFDGDLWFFSERSARLIDHLERDSHAGVTTSSSDAWVSLDGHAAVVDDRAKIKELWNPAVGAWLPNGPDDPNVVLVKFSAETAEYWSTPGGHVATAISFAKAKITGARFDGGDHDTVDLTD